MFRTLTLLRYNYLYRDTHLLSTSIKKVQCLSEPNNSGNHQLLAELGISMHSDKGT